MEPTSASSPGSEIQSLYESGLTQREVADRLGITQKVVFLTMRREGIPSRQAARRRERGVGEGWKGEAATYKAKHARVYYHRGSASAWLCAICEARPAEDWANLGNYNDPRDYAAMCRKCHRWFDRERRETDLRFAVLGDWRPGSGSGGDGF